MFYKLLRLVTYQKNHFDTRSKTVETFNLLLTSWVFVNS